MSAIHPDLKANTLDSVYQIYSEFNPQIGKSGATTKLKRQFGELSIADVFKKTINVVEAAHLIPTNKKSLASLSNMLKNIQKIEEANKPSNSLIYRRDFLLFFLTWTAGHRNTVNKLRGDLKNIITVIDTKIAEIEKIEKVMLQEQHRAEAQILVFPTAEEMIRNTISSTLIGRVVLKLYDKVTSTPSSPSTPTPPSTASTPAPQKPSNKIVLDLQSNFKSTKLHQKHLNEDIHVSSEIPNFPNPMKLAQTFDLLFKQIKKDLPQIIQDDEHTKNVDQIFNAFKVRISNLESGHLMDVYGNPASTQLISKARNILMHIFHTFQERKKDIDAEQDPNKKNQLTKKYNQDLKTCLIRLGVAYQHCSERMITDTIEVYYKYVESDTSKKDSHVQAKTLKQKVYKHLLNLRREIFVEVSREVCHTANDIHQAASERYFQKELNQEFSLQFDPIIFDETIYERYARKNLLDKVREEFLVRYNERRIIDDLSRAFMDPTVKTLSFQKLKKWCDKKFEYNDEYLCLGENQDKINPIIIQAMGLSFNIFEKPKPLINRLFNSIFK